MAIRDLYKPTLGWSLYRDVNPVPTNPLMTLPLCHGGRLLTRERGGCSGHKGPLKT